jgi:hypothetical protein
MINAGQEKMDATHPGGYHSFPWPIRIRKRQLTDENRTGIDLN